MIRGAVRHRVVEGERSHPCRERDDLGGAPPGFADLVRVVALS
jgi:hypothetical protein